MTSGPTVQQLETALSRVAAKRTTYRHAAAALSADASAPGQPPLVYASSTTGSPFVFTAGLFVARTDAASVVAAEQAVIDAEVRELCRRVEEHLGS